MKKQSLSLILTFCIIFGIFFCASAYAQESGTIGADISWILDDSGTLTISGYGPMRKSPELANYKDKIKNVIIEEGIKSIYEEFFKDFPYIKSIKIPSTVSSVGVEAFVNCSAIESIEVSDSNKDFCSVDGNLYTKDKTKFIAYAIGKSDTSFVLPESVEIIETLAFFGAKNLAEITFHDNIIRIGMNAFSETTWYNNQPNGVVYAGKGVYCYKGDLSQNSEVVIADGTNKIYSHAFSPLHSQNEMQSIYIPKSVTEIAEYVFDDCPFLQNIYFAGSEDEFMDIFSGYIEEAEITYDYKEPKISVIKTTDENKNVTAVSVTPFCVPDKSAVMLAGFFGNRLSDLQFLPKADGVLSFNTTKQADNFEVFVWDGLGTMKPITKK